MKDVRWAAMGGAGFALGVVSTLLYARFTVLPRTVATVSAPEKSAPVVFTPPPAAVTPVVTIPPGAAPTSPSATTSPKPPAAPKAAKSTKAVALATKTTRRDSVSNVDDAGVMQLIIPVEGIRASQLRDTYSDARGSGRKHDAIDIMAAHGTPVLAAAPAVVVKQDRGARGGIALYARAPDNHTIYYYAHLDRYAPGVVEGTTLRAGDVLGYVGDTGNAGPGNYHLHFEITTTADPKRYWGGVSHNPYPLLRSGITVK
jgi:murein DD-endopeptidase MepM/ murein hydrolase activator NlpD